MLKTFLLPLCIFFTTSSYISTTNANELIQTDRYTLVALAVPDEQREPLLTVANISLGSEVQSVGDAITEVLKGSGYRWQSSSTQDHLLFDLPLPEITRMLGPIRLQDAIAALAGNAWTLKTDPLHRTIWFEINEDSQFTNRKEED